MKPSIITLLVISFLAPPLMGEENKPAEKPADKPGDRPGARPEGKRGPGRGDGSFFRDMDKDGDRAISKEEAGEKWERLGKLDKDSDGKVTMQEMMAGRPDGDRPGGPGRSDGPGGKGKGKVGPEMFKRADKNNDGKLTEDEVPAEAWARLSRLDKDGDKAVSQEEARAGRPGGDRPGGPDSPGRDGEKGRGEEMWKRADKNGDGKLSKDELPEQAWERMSKLDKNNDGAVTREEMAAGFAAMRGAKGDGKGKGPGRYGDRDSAGGAEAVFSRFDENKDSKLAEDEVPGEMWDRLRRADTDADGLVSKDELGKVYGDREKMGEGPAKPKDQDKKRPPLEDPAV